jgi:hypothetical protein
MRLLQSACLLAVSRWREALARIWTGEYNGQS